MIAALLAALAAIGQPADWTPLSFRGIPPLNHTIEKPIDALGLWLMADGDNTESTFTVTITGIELTAP